MTNTQVCAAYVVGAIAAVSLGVSLVNATRKPRKGRINGR